MGRPGSVYAIAVRHPVTGRRVRFGYVGKTRQLPSNRIRQHRDTKPWADTIVGWEVLWASRRCTGVRLWWEEVWRIVLLRPLYNYQWNRWNPRRIPIYRQHRTARPGPAAGGRAGGH